MSDNLSSCDLLDEMTAEIKVEFNLTNDSEIGPLLQTNPALQMKFQQFHEKSNRLRSELHAEYGIENERILHQVRPINIYN